MRVAIVAACPFPSPQGSQVLAGQMAERLAERGHEVHLLTYGQGQRVQGRGYVHHQSRRLPGDDATRSGPHVVKPILDLLLAQRLTRLVREERFDVIHCHNYEATVIGLIVRRCYGVPIVYHSHNLMADEFPTYFRGRLSRAVAATSGQVLDASVPCRADRVIALCDYTAERLRVHGVTDERLSVIPPAVDDQGPAGPREPARVRLAVPLRRFVIGYCGNLDGYQNLVQLAGAVSRLEARAGAGHYVWLVITHEGGGRLASLLRQHRLVDSCRVVVARDYRRARLAMEACDVLVVPRRTGSGFPIKLLNYMGLGRPIVAAGCGAKAITPEIDGLIVPDDDPAAMADALERIEAQPELAHRLAGAARQRFLQKYTWDAVLPEVENVYGSVVMSKGSFPLPRVM